jgi:hypothetical protein
MTATLSTYWADVNVWTPEDNEAPRAITVYRRTDDAMTDTYETKLLNVGEAYVMAKGIVEPYNDRDLEDSWISADAFSQHFPNAPESVHEFVRTLSKKYSEDN